MRILIANRGEIARRIIAGAHKGGHSTVAVYADPDRMAPHVSEANDARRIGPADLAASYLNAEALIGAMADSGADAVHPGYGFLAENGAFARAVIGAGYTWIGPHPEAMERMGSKIEARRIADSAGVPTIPGYDESQLPADLAAAADRIGYPVLVKASAGGGGRGIRIAHEPDKFLAALEEASTEAERAFGDGAMIVERFIQQPRHVEVQLIGDKHGNVIHLGTRECSLQRRYQKVIEEAPAPNLPAETIVAMGDAAVALGHNMSYDSAGTVEFIVDDVTGEFFFLEMNTRLQVEHPVTEQVTGLDLVDLMIRSAAGEPLGFTQEEVTITGHAFEARINAEDPWAGFVPQTGVVTDLSIPPGVRWDAAVVLGSEISPHYDSMIAKVIVDGPDRDTARLRLISALDHLVLGEVPHNAGFLRWLLTQPPVVAGRVTTRFIDELDDITAPDASQAAMAAADAFRTAADAQRQRGSVWQQIGPARLTTHTNAKTMLLERGEQGFELGLTSRYTGAPVATTVDLTGRRVAVNLNGETFTFAVPRVEDRWAPEGSGPGDSGAAITSPFPAIVVEVHAVAGQSVAQGDVLVVIEAMKMLHSLEAKGDAVIAEVRVAAGDQVESNSVLVTFAEAPE